MSSEFGPGDFQSPSEGGVGGPGSFRPPPAGIGRSKAYADDEDAGQRYDPPPTGVQGAVEAAAVSQTADVLSGVPSAVLEAKDALEQQLAQAAAAPAHAFDANEFTGLGNVQGVAVGLGGADMNAAAPGSPCLIVYLAESATSDQVQALVAQAAGVSASAVASSCPTRTEVVGIIDPQPHRFKLREAPAGISVGHFKITAGTVGCFVTGRAAPRDNRILMLSNNHVLADVNNAVFGDAIVQPGPADGGSSPADQVAVLERFVPIDFSGSNFVDCATGWCWPDRVKNHFVFLSGGNKQFFQMGSSPVVPVLEMAVMKSGRTTQVTTGRITGIGGAINVNYGGRIAHFRDVISITGHSGDFSQGGDSGSLIMTNNSLRQPVGLLFAGGGGTTFANRIDRVMDALDIRFIK